MGARVGAGRGRPPNVLAYYVAMAGIFSLLLVLCCYFCYFFLTKVKELSRQEQPSQTPAARPPIPTAYPVQPVVRESATAMARLCRQSAGPATVFPTSTSPAAQHTDTGTAGTDSTASTASTDDAPPSVDSTVPPAAADKAGPAADAVDITTALGVR